ncbi:hypothetical protein LSH36_924g00042 [Paralvinella palmiformis]|uniref:Protein disulfide-isomerase n=1 Tax=Paralvinella palmiformis TaxID=53620 RepID=A0AAD9IY21_9ANNE|nr:hypothetical protein LSH36_924g00042 [Paralvinella palmiformis]
METWKMCWLFFSVFLFIAVVSNCDESAETTTDEEGDKTDLVDGVEEEGGVLVLNEDNFQDVIDSHETILVEFYAPWCGHCKQLAPEYEKAAEQLKQNDPPVALAKVDATEQKDLASRFGISGYPTLKVFKNGQDIEYKGPRTADGIVDYMKERADPDWKPEPSKVVVLTSENFTYFVNDHELTLVEFYAPWCGHCKSLAPEYETAATSLMDDEIVLAKVDATTESSLAKEYKVTGYPTLMIFRYGKAYEYKGERSSSYNIADYMRNQKGPATKSQSGLKELQRQMKKDDITVVGFFDDTSDKRFDVYESFTNSIRDEYTSLHTFDKEAREHYKVNPGTMVVFNAERFYSKHEPKWYTMEIEEDTEDRQLLDFIKSHELPLVGHLTYSTASKRYIKDGRKPIVMVFYDVDWTFDHRDATQKIRLRAVNVAKDYKDDFTFIIADEKENSAYFRDFGFDDSSEDLNIGILSPQDRKYPMEPMEDGYDEELIREFLDNYKNGKLKPKIKSQRPPKKQGVVTVVVGDTFDKIVMDPKKDVMIEFYAPSCGHCKRLEPKYKELAKKYKKERNLVIAKMDATANDSPEQFEVSGYPTIYFAPANDKKNPKKYDGDQEVDDLTKFIKDNAFLPLGKSMKKEEL